MVIFDLEWNSGRYERLKLNEILQIGAVKINRLGGPVVDTLTLYIRPSAHKRYSPPVLELPDLPLIEASDLDFPAAIRQFFDWCGEDRSFGTWGTSDMPVLLENLRYWKVSGVDMPQRYYNLQAAFAQAVGTDRQLALFQAVEYCGFPDVFDYHDPRNDAFYTALVTWAFDEKDLEENGHGPKGQTALVDLTIHPPCWTGQRQGPFEDQAALLNSRSCRLAPCPTCGGRVRVPGWHSAGGGVWLAKFTCPDHGLWFLRLLVSQERGKLYATSQVLDSTEGARLLFSAAKQGKSFQCTPVRRKRKRRRGKRPVEGKPKT